MPICSVQFYDDATDFQPSRYGVVKADTEGRALHFHASTRLQSH